MSHRTRIAVHSALFVATISVIGLGCSSSHQAIQPPAQTQTSSGQSSAGQGSQGSVPTPALHVTILIRNYSFQPESVAVRAGGTITFLNKDSVAHSAIAPNGSFATPTIAPGASVTVHVKRSATGAIPYICGIHQFMKGTVNVRS